MSLEKLREIKTSIKKMSEETTDELRKMELRNIMLGVNAAIEENDPVFTGRVLKLAEPRVKELTERPNFAGKHEVFRNI